jgi:hypothetical protein
MNKETYLGDGLYASFDGWQFKLRAPRDGGDHEVYLDDVVLAAFEAFVKTIHTDTALRMSDPGLREGEGK